MTMPDETRRQIFEELQQIATQVGGTVHAYPSPRDPVRRRTLRQEVDGEDTRFEEAVLDRDGAVYVIGADRGPKVEMFFGSLSYEWVYVIPPVRVPDLVAALVAAHGGSTDDDVLELLAGYYPHGGGRLNSFLTSPPMSASFDTWHS
jgi:hypothetical protein